MTSNHTVELEGVVMRTIGAFVVLGLLLLGLVAPVAAQEASPVASPVAMGSLELTAVDGVITFTVLEVPASDAVVDQAPGGDSAGDILIFANDVFDETGTTQVGTDQGWCFRTSVERGAWECTWTIFLAQGQIVVQGPYFDAGPSILAIIGGTGEFSGATGQMALETVDNGITFTYEVEVD